MKTLLSVHIESSRCLWSKTNRGAIAHTPEI